MDLINLTQKFSKTNTRKIASLFEGDAKRAEDFSIQVNGIFLDYAKQNITATELKQLLSLAKTSGLTEKIRAQFSGEKINNTEQRAVLHSALRASSKVKETVLGKESDEVISTEKKMAAIVDKVSSQELTSYNGKAFTDVVAIGIGGSYYGIKVAVSALKPYHSTGIKAHVIANVDGSAVEEKLSGLNAETTLVVVISKTFTTQETLLNANAVKSWMLKETGDAKSIDKQWFAVSSNVKQATDFGLNSENVLPMWDWVGGRFSVWSAVGFPLALVIGNDNFNRFKQGANAMDEHFVKDDFEQNMPVLMAMLGIWNRNVLSHPSLAILPYDHSLRALPGYLQQTDMESNGKSVSSSGEKLPWLTAPVVFGQEGTNGQHAFMQLMHQSVDIVPTDFIVCIKPSNNLPSHHQVLIANCFAQSEALMQGKSLPQAKAELEKSGLPKGQAAELAKHKTMKGNTPSNTLLISELTPENLGALLALYEHKIFVQGVIWQLNSFDQWGVELGKQLSQQILKVMAGAEDNTLSDSTLSLITRLKK